MRVAVMYGPGDVRVEDRPEPTIHAPTDAIIRLAASCICGSGSTRPPPGYQAMDQRRAIKVLLRTQPVLANR